MPDSLRSQDDPPSRLPDPAAPGRTTITVVAETAPGQRQQHRRPPCGSCNSRSGGPARDVSLVMTFNLGMIVERPGGIETGRRELLERINWWMPA